MKWFVTVLCLWHAGSVVGNSLKDPYICGPPACIPSQKFKYLPDVMYEYDYTVNVNTWFEGSSNNHSTMDVTANVKIQFITPCEGLLELSGVTLTDQDASFPAERADKFIHALSLYELRFAYHDGVISEICPEEAEEDWVLNFKRGILSLFQNTMKRFDINFKGVERDIHGTCAVEYTVRGQENTSLIIVKTRDLAQCTDRYKYLSILQTVRYHFQSKFQTWPVLKSESKCRITVDHFTYKSVTCRERHLFSPFSGRAAGAVTSVQQQLLLRGERPASDAQRMQGAPKTWNVITTRSNLLHRHSSAGRAATGELKSARNLLKVLCQIKDGGEVVPQADPRLDSGSAVGVWGGLVRAARSLDRPALALLLARAPQLCERAQKHIMDALPYIASEGSVELIKEMITAGSVELATREEWLMSLAMIPRPQLGMLESMLELLQSHKHDKAVSFAASSMLHSYCKHGGKPLRECCDEEVPKQILEEFQNIVVGIYKRGLDGATRSDRDNLVVGIKAAGNVGGFRRHFSEVLLALVGDALAPARLRLTAIDAFRKTPCIDTREYFLEMYCSDLVAVEVRLASYLQVMRCPDLGVLRKIFHALRHERVNQAATFVWSHLNNLGQSSLPSRVEIQGLLSGNTVPQLEDQPDFRMFSRNYEQGVFFDQYNAGGNYEANVIFSPDSYIPRSVSLNLTVDMFGESVNLLELKARGEGFERYFESVFGAGGALSKSNLYEMFQNLRSARSLRDADDARRKVDDLHYKNEALRHQFPMAELAVRVFGNEISYWSAEGDGEIRKSLERVNPQLRILEILSGKEISYNKASLFLDTTFSVPTACGLPLNLNLMGTSYVNLNMSGTLHNISDNIDLDFEGKIHPSVSVNVAATMGVVAGRLSSTGLRVNARLYTATALEVALRVRGMHLARLQLSLPRSKQEIFAAKSELLILHGDEELQQQGLNRNRIERNTCSWTTFDQAIGVKICAAYQFPNMTNIRNAPYFIMSGPSQYVVSLEKADPSANTYELQYDWQQNVTTNMIRFSFDTPNSKEKRTFHAEVNLSQNSSNALVSFQSAKSTLEAKALYRNLEYDKCIEASLDIDGRKHFDTVMSLKRHDIKAGYVWLPLAYWVVNDEKIAALSGTLKMKSKGGVSQCDVQAEFQTKQLASRLVGYYTVNGPTRAAHLTLDYQFYRSTKQAVRLEGVCSEKAAPAGHRHDLYGDLSMEFTAYPGYDFYAVLRNMKSPSHLDVGFNVSTSRSLRAAPWLSFSLVRGDRAAGMRLRTELAVVRARPLRVMLIFEEAGPKYSGTFLLSFNPNSRAILVTGSLYQPPGAQLYVDAALNMTLPTLHPLSVTAKVHEKRAGEFQMNSAGVWFTGVDFNIDALYQDQSKTNMVSHRVKVLINSSHFKDIAVDARLTQDNRQLTVIGQGEYNEDKYRTLIRYILLSEQNFTTYGELDVSGKQYSVNLNADLSNNTVINMDLHFDQYRDVHVKYARASTAQQKRLSAAVNWDANRDPSQKVSVDAQLDTLAAWHRAGHVVLVYPGQVVNGEFDFLLKDWFCQWLVRVGWSSADVVVWRVKLYSEATRAHTVHALLSDMSTPLAGWRDTSFNLMWLYHDNLQAINGSMSWQQQRLAFSLLADYMLRTDELYGELRALVNSTLPALPRAAAVARHRVLWKKSADTLLSFQYNEEGKLMINSSWVLDRGASENNVTGSVSLITPFQGYSRGLLTTKLVLGHKRDIAGISHLDLEGRVLKILVNGHMRRLTHSMLVVNVTRAECPSPPLVTARLGFLERDRHLVAMLATPNSTTGVEVVLRLQTAQDFHVFGHVALPIPYLNRAMLIAKRATDEADFRLGWGVMEAGVTGIWRYVSPLHFLHLYKLYTPLEGLEESGIVLKNLYGPGLDTELSVRLANHKFGIAILLHDNGRGFLEALRERLRHDMNHDTLIDDFDTTARVTLDTLYYHTITFDSHVWKIVGADEEDILQLNATLHLPNKSTILLTDVFVLETWTEMRNDLALSTPFQFMKELKSVYTVDLVMTEKVNVTCTVLLSNGTYWHEISYKMYYEFEQGDDDAYESYVTALQIVTPLDVLPSLQCHVLARLEGTLWKMAADIGMPSFTVKAQGKLELDEPFVETSGSLNLTSPFLQDYFIRMEFHKDFSDAESSLGGGLHVQQGEHDNYLFAEAVWRGARHVRVTARGALHPALPPSAAALALSDERTGAGTGGAEGARTAAADLTVGNSTYTLQATERTGSLAVALTTPHQGFRAVKVLAELEADDIRGSLVTDTLEYSVTGKTLNREPLEISLVLVPKGSGEPVTARVKCESGLGGYSVSAQLSGGLQLTVRAAAHLAHNYTDLYFKVDNPASVDKEIYLKTRIDSYPDLRRVVSVQAATPLKRIKYVKGDADFVFGPKSGYVLCRYDVPDMRGDGELRWSFLLGNLFIKALGHQYVLEHLRSIDLDIYFGNRSAPAGGLPLTDAGFKLDLDRVWLIGANFTFGLLQSRLHLVINAILPRPSVDVHTLYIAGDMRAPGCSLEAKYSTDVTRILTGVKGNVLLLPEDFNGNATVLWTSNATLKTVDNLLIYKWDGNGSHHVDYTLVSPLYQNHETFQVKGSFQRDLVHDHKVVKGMMQCPGGTRVGEVDVRYGGARHTAGHFNLTTPFPSLPWLRSVFDINNLDETADNKIRLFWPNKTASLNTTHRHTASARRVARAGQVALALPLSKEHLLTTDYYYIEEGDASSTGNATVDVDGERLARALFTQSTGRSARDLQLSVTDIQVENAHTPLGVKYIHEYDGTGKLDVKQATVFHLQNVTKFNVTGKVDVTTHDTGKNIIVTAIHGQRTLTFENEYEAAGMELKQGSKLKWAEDTWLNYHVHVTNKTTSDTESQQLVLKVWYPLRTFNLAAVYRLHDTLLEGSARLDWDVRDDNKTAELRARWDTPPARGSGAAHRLDLAISHPSFSKDITLNGHYITTPEVMSNVSLELQYSDYENEYLRLESVLTDNSDGPVRDYQLALNCTHPATSLDLEVRALVTIHSGLYLLENYYRLQKSLFAQKLRHTKVLVDMNNTLVRYERSNETYFYKLNGTWELAYPEYLVRASVLRPTGSDAGLAVLSLASKSLRAHFNSTDDISYHVVGAVADTRSARLDAWRDYDDVTTVELASYLRLNHSRLLTTSLRWRPEVFADLKHSLVYALRQVYTQANETITVIKEAPQEAHAALRAIWGDARPRIREFLDDLNDLHVIKDDLDDFQVFLNTSYNNNDFYVKDMVTFTYYVLDEMAIRNHLESLPGIVNDMWGMMGNTSLSIRQSLGYVVETVKKAYVNFIASMTKFLEADFMELVSEKLEAAIMHYDTFIRDVHMKFLEYWERTWVHATTRLSAYWHELLRSLEPLFFKAVHYTEALVFGAWRGLMDFFYSRTHELTDSPYFNYVATFGHEMDRIYKDIVQNDLITNIKKYSSKLWNVLWSKLERYIPFRDEVAQLGAELGAAWASFLHAPPVTYVIEKYKEAYTRLRWWYDYFLIGETLDALADTLYNKVTELARTALQYEEQHRTPKTRFIFDPRKGEITLEQKLPMSWHAFNRTPDFSEIAEYKAVRDFMDQWLTTNKSIWSYYYEIRPYMDLNNILPPFGGMAMMTGQGTLVTFDKTVFTISAPGTFLLSKDYRQNNFTVLMESNEQGRYDLLVLTRRSLLRVDLYREQVSLGAAPSAPLTLPSVVDGYLVDREADSLTVQGDNGLAIQCNLLFHTCKLQVTGWYYASVGGLLGTYNNERYDDLLLAAGSSSSSSSNSSSTARHNNLSSFVDSWRIERGTIPVESHESKNDTQCEKFFQNNVSPLHPCFSAIDASPFMRECVRGAEPCALASAYLELCAQQHVPTHIPEQCVQCTTPQGDVVEEGSLVELQRAHNSSDLVFVVEARACNMNIRKRRSIDLLLESVDSKLQGSGLNDNRYAVVVFGGRGVYRRARSLYVNNRLFTNAIEIPTHFDQLVIEKRDGGGGGGGADMFAALRHAAALPYRAGVPRALVLLPCSACRAEDMRLDYSTIYHNLMENSITLHILMDDDFSVSKRGAAKNLFGIDSTHAYTNKDYERLVGDAALRKQVKLPKAKLGLCTSLAMETNGTIVSGRALGGARAAARRCATVAGALWARGARARGGCSARCECRDSRLSCRPCADTVRAMELSFWNTDDFEDLIDMAMEPPSLPGIS